MELEKQDIASIPDQRTLSLVNTFVASTAQFLNKFSSTCDEKLEQTNRKIQLVNERLELLEFKISNLNILDEKVNVSMVNLSDKGKKIDNSENEATEIISTVTQTNSTVQHDYRHPKYIQMFTVGVPLEAVKLKMKIDGTDPTVLDQLIQSQLNNQI